MSLELWEQAEELFHAALNHAPATRAQFLAEACAGDAALRVEVEALLQAAAEAPEFIVAETPLILGADWQHKQTPPRAGNHLGPYRLEREIGHGGMGAVWLAVRDDAQFTKQVAIKFVRTPGFAAAPEREILVRRFREERQMLAQLEHPNIARLIDGGETAAGLPWLALEYVAGERLDRYCDEQRLTLTARLRLFCTICAAVEHAHRSLIIHRDLKPGNILVTAEGAPKLLDFGIAKLFKTEASGAETEAALSSLAATPPGQTHSAGPASQLLMTPGYASPEQVSGAPITTASDVYSLGVLLYELLCGHRPYQVAGLSPDELQRVVCTEIPRQPSEAVRGTETVTGSDGQPLELTPQLVSEQRGETQPARLRRQLAGDLDNIVMKALHKQPEQRYNSVEQLAADIQRHLQQYPVQASPATWPYRALKFVRRNTRLVAAGTLLLAALAGGMATTTWQARRARAQAVQAQQEKKNAEQARKNAEEISAFLQEVFSYAEPNASGPGGGRSPNVKLEDALRDAQKRLETKLQTQPAIRAELHVTLGKVWQMRGDYQAAEEQFRRALALRRQLHGERHMQVARAMYFLHVAIHQRGRRSDEPRYDEPALQMMRETDPQHGLLPWMILNQGSGLTMEGQFERGEALIREAQELFGQRFGRDHLYVAVAVVRLAESCKMRGALTQAQELYREFLTRTSQAAPDAERANAHANIGWIALTLGNGQEATQAFTTALEIFRQYLGADHPHSLGPRQGLATLAYLRRDYATAEALARRALDIARQKYGPESNFTIEALGLLSKVLLAQGQPQRAAPYLREALTTFQTVTEKNARQCPGGELVLGECQTLLKHYEEAERFLLAGYRCTQPYRAPRSPEMAALRQALAQLYQAWGKPEQAIKYQQPTTPSSPGEKRAN